LLERKEVNSIEFIIEMADVEGRSRECKRNGIYGDVEL
jgi:hypothetical protein